MAKQFRFEKDKFAAMDLMSMASDMAKPARAAECPMHLEARVRKLGRAPILGRHHHTTLAWRIVSQVQRIPIGSHENQLLRLASEAKPSWVTV